MAAYKVEVGAQIGWMRVLSEEPRNKHGQRVWLCECRCGEKTVGAHHNLASGRKLSCGCMRDQAVARRNETHGHSHVGHVSREYSIWLSMKDRCLNPDSSRFHDYGKRGIRVCVEWQDSFEAFLRDLGPRPSPQHSLERDDVNGHYEPGNCRWATKMEQAANTRRNRKVTYQGESIHVSEAARRSGLSERTILSRLRLGWPVDRLFLPADRSRHFKPKTGRPAKNMLPYNGKMVPLAEVARLTGISRYTLEDRVARGWPLAQLYAPPDKSRKVMCA